MNENSIVNEAVSGRGSSARPQLTGSILITGGAGFIGRAILQRAWQDGWDAHFTVLSRDETKQHVLQDLYPKTFVRCALGDIRDGQRLKDIMWGHDIVIHAAALKYIPEAEDNVAECIDINLTGSINVLQLAQGVVDHVVALGTDKAALPNNVYGATKMLMERVFCEGDLMSPDTRYTCVRYGNVIGSTGSVIPRMRERAMHGDTIQLTDPNMTRFWITADEAIDLIVEAAAVEERGATLIPNPKAMTLMHLAEAICASIEGDPDVPIDTIGLRPGEKMHEHLMSLSESLRAVHLDGIDGGYLLLPTGRHGDGDQFELSSEFATRVEVDDMVRHIRASLSI